MNYDKETRPNGVSSLTAEVLAEAMPWIKNCTGKTIVIKYGGAAMVDAQLRAEVMADIVLLKIIGVNPVIVHGGGKAITEAMEQRQLDVRFVEGQRVTTDEAMEVVRTVLTGKVNQELVAAINAHGNLAVGVSGADAGTIIASQADIRLGRVGKVERINSQLLEDLGQAISSRCSPRWASARTAASTTSTPTSSQGTSPPRSARTRWCSSPTWTGCTRTSPTRTPSCPA